MPRNKNYDEGIALEKALNVFWTNGYKATSIRMLEKEMGINQFSIYSSFRSKKELFLRSIRKYREYVKENVYNELLEPGAGFAEFKKFLLNAGASQNKRRETRGCLVVNTAAELGNNDAEIAREIDLYYNFIRNMIKKILLTAVNKNEISRNINVDQQANFFLGVMQGISIASKTMGKDKLIDFVSVAIKQIE